MQRLTLFLPLAIAACAQTHPPTVLSAGGGPGPTVTLDQVPPVGGVAAPRLNGEIGSPNALTPAQLALGGGTAVDGVPAAPSDANLTGGDVTLDFTDTDIRDAVAQILGTTLQVTYTIDPNVRGTVTFHSGHPLARTQLISILQTLLAQNNAVLLRNGAVFRVAPAASAGVPSFSADDAGAGGNVIALHYASAEDLVKVLQPVVGAGARITADAGRNAIIIAGEPQSRDALSDLVRSFDTDLLAGQSYALLPVGTGDAKDLASTMEEAFASQSGGALAGLVRVLPLTHANAVLVVTNNPRYLEDARRVYALVQRNAAATDRAWHVYYLQNSRADDVAYTLQRAFTPHDVTAQPESTGQNSQSSLSGLNSGSSGGGSSSSGFGLSSGGGLSSGSSSSGLGGGGTGASSGGGLGGLTLANGANTGGGASSGTSPLVGSLEGGGGDEDENTMRIISNPQNNAILVYGTEKENDTVEAMLDKIDLMPLQVRIDATIAEVTLNDQLQFGTQFFFKEGSVNQLLTNATSAATNPPSFSSGAPGFIFGAAAKGVQATISALQAVTTVHVLSSPELMVLDNQPAFLQVGALVPYLTGTATGTSSLLSGTTVNSVSYEPTGVILQVTPRVNSNGQVTMDISQEVSSVDTTTTTSSIGSPTFDDRVVKSRVVVQDGQTLGIAGLISDSISRGNQGIPFLKDIPILGLLVGTQNNNRQRTELLVMITPHVVHDQRDALALTQDLKDQLLNAAEVPAESQSLEPSGSADPSARGRRRLGLQN